MRKALMACGLAVATFSSAAFGATPHDGVWAVSMVTKSGDCDSALSSRIQVREGRVNESMLFARISGAVNASGEISLQVQRGSDAMKAQGRIRGEQASGSWNSPSRNCSGIWTAVRA